MSCEFKWPRLLGGSGTGIAYGGDYNPDQWPESIWAEDIRLMCKANVNVVALGIFSWDRIQPAEHEWDFGWLDRIIGMLGDAGISVDLASATASAPLWLYEQYPQVLPRDKFGHAINAGSRQSWSASSPVFREHALELCNRLASRYGDNPTVTAWHVGNEYGWNNRHDYSDDALEAFRAWCERKYGSVDRLNEAWCSAFWSQEVHSFREVLLPRHMGADSMVNPAQQLDFERFSNDALLDFYRAERDEIARICPDKPITTNFMVSTDQCAMDYSQWAKAVDFVSNDHYFHEGESHLDELLCSDSLVWSLARGNPWYLMEHSTSNVQWKPVNARKCNGELMRDALAHVAMGADAINFFQWRQSRGGAEAFHSAMLPHAGADTKVFRQVCETGQVLKDLSERGVAGTTVTPSRVAILFDAQSQWSTEIPTLPTTKLDHWHDVRDWYRAFLDAGMRADVVPLAYEWEQYDLLVLPTIFMLSDSAVHRIEHYVDNGGSIVVGYATGIVNDSFQVGLGGYPGAGNGLLRRMLGVSGEEFNIVGVPGADDVVELTDGGVSNLWQTCLTRIADDAQVLASYTGAGALTWELEGMAAIVSHDYGAGHTWYVGCDLRRQDITHLICEQLVPCLGIELGNPGIVTIDRTDGTHVFRCRLNRSGNDVSLRLNPGVVPEGMLLIRGDCEGERVTLHSNGILIEQIHTDV
ncbi:beta-galactosidase [Bifidobacterium animalis subsp. animalis]|nr:beta-galactosidase [Bifidobacterium animalis subsp. animalis]